MRSVFATRRALIAGTVRRLILLLILLLLLILFLFVILLLLLLGSDPAGARIPLALDNVLTTRHSLPHTLLLS